MKRKTHVVVGGGTGGCFSSTQILEHANVILIESGDIVSLSKPIDWPKISHSFESCSNSVKCIKTEPTNRVLHRSISLPYGCGLGGSFNINAMLFSAGFIEDYKLWSNINVKEVISAAATVQQVLFPNDSFEDSLFEKNCTNFPHHRTYTSDNKRVDLLAQCLKVCSSGNGGVLIVLSGLNIDKLTSDDEITANITSLKCSFIQTVRCVVYKPSTTGYIACDGFVWVEEYSPNISLTGLLIQIQRKYNLTVHFSAEVLGNIDIKLQQSSNIILSCGCIGTPSLLSKSQLLPQSNIDSDGCYHHSIQDHCLVPVIYFLFNWKELRSYFFGTCKKLSISDTPNEISELMKSIFAVTELQFERRNGIYGYMYLNEDGELLKDGSRPSIQLLFVDGRLLLSEEMVCALLFPSIGTGLFSKIWENIRKLIKIFVRLLLSINFIQYLLTQFVFGVLVCNIAPKSTGRISISGRNLSVNMNYLESLEDRLSLIKGIEFVRNVFSRVSWNIMEILPSLLLRSGHNRSTTESIYLSFCTNSYFHMCGSCNDAVTSAFKVKNTKNVWIADASVIPFITSAPIACTICMLGCIVARYVCEN